MKQFLYKIMPLCALLSLITTSSHSVLQNGCSADFIVVGMGTAGTILTRRLSDPDENGQFVNSVLTLEEGQNYTSDPNIIDVNIFTVTTNANQAYQNPKYSRRYVVPLSPSNFHIPPFPSGQVFEYGYGRMWGGSGGHDFLLAVRGSYDVYNDWAAISGDTRWLAAGLIPTFKADENYVGLTQVPAERGTGGTLTQTQFPPVSLATDPFSVFVQTGTSTRSPILLDYNVSGAELSISANQNLIIQTNAPNFGDGIRQFSPDFLTGLVTPTGEGLNGRKLKIQSGATVTRVIFSGTKAIGVEYILDGNPEEVFYAFARKKIILSAGALSDCAILQRSGIGDPAVLTPLGIPVLVNNPLVGVGLETHYGVIGAMLNNASSGPLNTPGGLLWSDLSYQFPAPVVGNGLRDWQFIYVPVNALDPKINTALGYTAQTPMISFIAWTLRPKAVGTIQIQDTDPLNVPQVIYNFYTDGPFTTPGTDAANAVQAFRVMNSIATAAGLTMAYPLPAHFASDAQLYQDALASYSITNHYSGSCDMGTSIANGVVDGAGNVFGVTNLAVGDLSIAPTSLTGNTRLAAMIIAEKVAQANGAVIPT
jgi:choline dehydrogenase